MTKTVRRLYPTFHPETYDLDLTINPKNMSTMGSVVIKGKKVGRPSKRITLHQKNLRILSVKIFEISANGNNPLKVKRIVYQNSFNEVRFHFDHDLYAGKYQIEISYIGKINTQLHGIYNSTFKDGSREKTIICTQFESHYAREALPCIDEPEAKSVYSLTLRTPKELTTSISNTELISSKIQGQYIVNKFDKTPLMSSYLLAFVSGDLQYLEGHTNTNVRVRTYATNKNVKHTRFALDCAIKTLDFYNEYFDISYPLSKCDLIALPDFSSGAMENWGCITFREQALLVDPKTTSLDLKQYVANVVAHELTHQWFGNLVTMKWWNDLWLNESFASWMSYLAVDHLFPKWHVWTQFIVDEQGVGLKQDSLENTHPIEVKIHSPEEIRNVFDAISYEKGASVITMLNDYLGPSVFRDGIRKYLKQHSYSNTDTLDLWTALEEVSEKPVAEFISRWTKEEGYPLVKVQYVDNINVHLDQHRFYLNPLAKKLPTIWPIPLFSSLDIGKNDPLFHRSINISLKKDPDNLIINQGRHGFYRTIYDDQTINTILSGDLMQNVPDVDRLGLISDAFEAAKAGYLPTLSVLKMLEHFFNESSLVVWEVIASGLASLRSVMDDKQLREDMKPFTRKLISQELLRLGLSAKKDDNHFDKLLRPIILGMAAVADEPLVLKEIDKLFSNKLAVIDPDIRGVVYTTIARHGGVKEYNALLKLHNNSISPEERLKLAAALTNFKQSQLINKSLKLITSKDVRVQDAAYWISYSFSNTYSREMTWQWLKDNWQWIEQNMGEDISFYRMPLYAANYFSSSDFLKVFKQFFSHRLSSAFNRPLKQAIETIEWRIEWRKRDLVDVKSFFSKWPKG
jgi:aminopeptidase N